MAVAGAVTDRPGGTTSHRTSRRRPARRSARGSAGTVLVTGLRGVVLRWGMFAVLVGLWEVVTRRADNMNFPAPSEILSRLHELYLTGPASHLFLNSAAREDIAPSLVRMLTGWLLAIVIGVTVGVALGRSSRAMDYVGPVVHFLRAVPPPALLPVFLVLLKAGDLLQVGIVVFGAVWPVLLNSIEGAHAVHRTQRDTAQVFRVGRARWVTSVVLPAAAPKIFAGLRLSLSLSLILMVIG